MKGMRLFGAALCVAVGLGCETYGVVGPGSPIIASFGGDSTSATSLVPGTWQRTLAFVDEFGFSNSNETTWIFQRDGTAVETIVTQNLTSGVSHSVVSSGHWQIQGTRIIVDFVTPQTGHLELEFRIDAGQLILAGESFTRVSS